MENSLATADKRKNTARSTRSVQAKTRLKVSDVVGIAAVGNMHIGALQGVRPLFGGHPLL